MIEFLLEVLQTSDLDITFTNIKLKKYITVSYYKDVKWSFFWFQKPCYYLAAITFHYISPFYKYVLLPMMGPLE